MSRALQRLVALALAGALALNYPLLSLFDSAAPVLGVPLLWLYLFVVWGLLIVLVAATLERIGRARPPTRRDGA